MTTITYFKTRSWGGMEGRDIDVRKFETEKFARENALKDTWNYDFTLYKVEMVFNGTITEIETKLGKIECGRDVRRTKGD